MRTNDILQIIIAGGSLHIDSRKHSITEMLLMANSAKLSKVRIFFENTEKMTLTDKLRLSFTGKEYVEFLDLV